MTAPISLDSRHTACTVAYCIGCEYAMFACARPFRLRSPCVTWACAGRRAWLLVPAPGFMLARMMSVRGLLTCALAQAVH
jgi:hypothetical protein